MDQRIDVKDVAKFIADGDLKDAFGNEEVRNYCLRTLSDFGCKPPTNRLLLFCCVRAGSPLMGYALKAANTNLLALLQKYPRIAGLFSKIASLCRQERDKERLKDHLMALMRGECANPPALDAASDLTIVQSLYQSQKLEGLDKQLQALSAQLHPKLAEILAKLQHDPVDHLMDQWLEGDTDSIADRIRYNSGIYPFVGRQNEIDLLDRFLGEPVSWSNDQAFRWLLLTGDGGTGKTRLAMEYVRHNLPAGWVGRRLPVGELDTMILWAPDWLPKAPTLIVLDYPAQRPEDVHRLLERLLRRSPYFDFPVRILLLERDAADSWFDQLFPSAGDGAALRRRAHIHDGEPLLKGHALTPPNWDDIAHLLARHLGHLPGFDQRQRTLQDYIWRLDPQTDGTYSLPPRPLYVLATIEWLLSAHAEGRDWTSLIDKHWSSEELLLSIIERDRSQFWQPEAKARQADLPSHERMVALASFMLGLQDPLAIRATAAEVGLGHLFPDQPSMPLLERMGRIEQGQLRELEPDLLGECHTLHHLLALTPDTAARFCQLAYRRGGDRAAAVAIRYMRDFPDHVEKLGWLAPPPGAEEGEIAAFAGYVMSIMMALNGDQLEEVWQILERRCSISEDPSEHGSTHRFCMALFNKAVAHADADRIEQEISSYEQLIERFASNELPFVQDLVAKAFYNKAGSLGNAGRVDEALATYDGLIALFGSSRDPALQEQVAMALVNKGVRLSKRGDTYGAIANYEDALDRFGDSTHPGIQAQMAMALFNKCLEQDYDGSPEQAGFIFDTLMGRFADSDHPAVQLLLAKALLETANRHSHSDRSTDAIAAYEELDRRFGESDSVAMQEQIAKALLNRGVLHGALGQVDDELVTYEDIARRFSESDSPFLMEQCALALFNRGVRLSATEQYEDEVATYSKLVDRYGGSDLPELQSVVAMAMVNKGARLAARNQQPDSLAIYDALIDRFGESHVVHVQVQIAKALLNKAAFYRALTQTDEALSAYQEIIARFGDSSLLVLNEQVALAISGMAEQLAALNRFDEEQAVYDDLFHRFTGRAEPGLARPIIIAILNKGIRLGQLEGPNEAVAQLDKLLSEFGSNDSNAVQEYVARALLAKAGYYQTMGQDDDALAVLVELVERFDTSAQPEVHPPLAMALVNKGVLHTAAGRRDAALVVYDDVISRFGDSIQPELQEAVAKAMVNTAISLAELGKAEDSIDGYRKTIKRFDDSEQVKLQEQVAIAMRNMAILLGQQGQTEEELATYRALLDRLADCETQTLQIQAVHAHVNIMRRLAAMDRKEEALAIMAGPLQPYMASDARAIRDPINSALLIQNALCRSLGQDEEAAAALTSFMDRQSSYAPDNLSGAEPSALFGKAMQLAEQDSFQEALAHLVAASAKLDGKTDHGSNSIRLGIQFTTVVVMGQLGAITEALSLLSQITGELPKDASPLLSPLLDQVDFLEACLHALNLDVPAAIAALGLWRDRMGSLNCQEIADETDFDAIRTHPDFIAFLRANGCEPPASH